MSEDHHHHHDHHDERAELGDPATLVAEHHRGGRGVRRIPYPIGIRRGEIIGHRLVAPHMIRLTLRGDDLRELPTFAADDHVKIVFGFPDGTRNDPVPNDHRMLDWSRPRPPTRSYTIRRHDAERGEIDLDFVVHPGGLAARWAGRAAVGEQVALAGPPGAKAFAHTYRHYLWAIDTTALPALARWLDEADWLAASGAGVDVFVDHDHDDERDYPLRVRPQVRMHWLHRANGSRLAETVGAWETTHDSDGVFVFVAGESGDIRALRRWVRESGFAASITGYWKRGSAGHEE